MSYNLKTVEYYNFTVEGHVGEGSKALVAFASVGIDLLAFKAVPLGSNRTQFTLLPEDGAKMNEGAQKAGLNLDGPYTALIIEGDEKAGALSVVYDKLSQAGIPVYESTGIAHIRGGYGVVLYLKPEDCDKAVAALKG
jgi:hypothetical protein